jgi:hypothetical protein
VNPLPEEVQDRESAVRFVKWCVDRIGLGYHSDTPFADYADRDSRATFSAPEAARLEELAERPVEAPSALAAPNSKMAVLFGSSFGFGTGGLGCGWRVPRGEFRRVGQSGPNVRALRPPCAARADCGG